VTAEPSLSDGIAKVWANMFAGLSPLLVDPIPVAGVRGLDLTKPIADLFQGFRVLVDGVYAKLMGLIGRLAGGAK
jgi:hypothetical protein